MSDLNDYVNVVVVYPVQRKFLPPVHPDSGYPPGHIQQQNQKGAAMVSLGDASANESNVVVIHFHKNSLDQEKQAAINLAEAARSAWTTAQTAALEDVVRSLAVHAPDRGDVVESKR